MSINRAQSTGPDLVGILIALTVISVVLFVGLNVFSEINQSLENGEFEEEVEGPQNLCNGMWGCNGPGPSDLLAPVILTFMGLALISAIRVAKGWTPESGQTETQEDDGQSQIAYVQNQYVSGDIDTTVKLEDELDGLLDPEVDNTAVDELDDLLGDDDDKSGGAR